MICIRRLNTLNSKPLTLFSVRLYQPLRILLYLPSNFHKSGSTLTLSFPFNPGQLIHLHDLIYTVHPAAPLAQDIQINLSPPMINRTLSDPKPHRLQYDQAPMRPNTFPARIKILNHNQFNLDTKHSLIYPWHFHLLALCLCQTTHWRLLAYQHF